MTWCKPFTGSPDLHRRASHSGLQTVSSKDSSPGPSAGLTSSWTPNTKAVGSPGSIVGSIERIRLRSKHGAHHSIMLQGGPHDT
jgi:hypothetical protein